MVRNPFLSLATQYPFNADPPHLSSRGRAIGYQVHTSNGYFTKISQQARPQRCGLTKHYPFTTPSLSPPLSLPLTKKTHLYCSTLIPFVSPPPAHPHNLFVVKCADLWNNLLHMLFSLSSHYGIPHPPNHPTPPPPKNPPQHEQHPLRTQKNALLTPIPATTPTAHPPHPLHLPHPPPRIPPPPPHPAPRTNPPPTPAQAQPPIPLVPHLPAAPAPPNRPPRAQNRAAPRSSRVDFPADSYALRTSFSSITDRRYLTTHPTPVPEAEAEVVRTVAPALGVG